VILPDEVPDDAAKSFALLYVMTFDNYTPATIEAATAALKARVPRADGRRSPKISIDAFAS